MAGQREEMIRRMAIDNARLIYDIQDAAETWDDPSSPVAAVKEKCLEVAERNFTHLIPVCPPIVPPN